MEPWCHPEPQAAGRGMSLGITSECPAVTSGAWGATEALVPAGGTRLVSVVGALVPLVGASWCHLWALGRYSLSRCPPSAPAASCGAVPWCL